MIRNPAAAKLMYLMQEDYINYYTQEVDYIAINRQPLNFLFSSKPLIYSLVPFWPTTSSTTIIL